MGASILDPAGYRLTLTAVPTLLTAAATLLIALYVLHRERISRVSMAFAVLSVTIATWLFSFSIMYCSQSAWAALWWSKAAYLGVPFIPAAVFHFTVSVLQSYGRHRPKVFAAYGLSLAFAVTIHRTDWLIHEVRLYDWGYYPQYNWLGAPYLVFFATMLAASYREYRLARSAAMDGDLYQQRLRAFQVAFAVMYLGCVDYLPKYGISIYPFGYLPILMFLALAARAVARYRLVDITPAFAAHTIVEGLADPLLVLDREGLIRVVNRPAAATLQAGPETLIGRPIFERGAWLLSRERHRALLHQGRPFSFEIERPAGQQGGLARHFQVNASVVPDRFGEAGAILCTARDVTEQRRAQVDLQVSEEKLRAVVNTAKDAILSTDSRGVIVSWNQGAERLFGYAAEEVLGSSRAMLLDWPGGDRPLLESFETTGRRKDGDALPLEVSLCDWSIHGDRFFTAVIRDLTDRRLAEELRAANSRLAHQALVDPLTELLNRRGLEDALLREVSRTRRESGSLMALLIDLDDFKTVNDGSGYSMGDTVLKSVARRLRTALRTTDHAGRIGGDEFLVLLPSTRSAEALLVAEKLRLVISRPLPAERAGNLVEITASVGLSEIASAVRSLDEVVYSAQSALYRSKASGKNRVSFAPQFDEDAVEHAASRVSLLTALQSGAGLRALQQPIVSLESREPVGFEFLTRMSEDIAVTPDEFFSLSRQANILSVVDIHCFRTCLAAAWPSPPGVRRHLNLFPSTLHALSAEHLLEEIRACDPSGTYCLELSEQEILGDPSYLHDQVECLRRDGVLVALDDVGFGHSSLESLVLLQPDVVKIDKRCVRGIGQDGAQARQLGRLLKLIHAVGATAVAEGVEEESDAACLLEHGVRFAQGYLFGKPA